MALLKKQRRCVDGPATRTSLLVRMMIVALSASASGCEEDSPSMTPREPAEVDPNDESATSNGAGDDSSGASHQQVASAAANVDAGAPSIAPGGPAITAGPSGAIPPIAPSAPLPIAAGIDAGAFGAIPPITPSAPLPIAAGIDAGALGAIPQTVATDPATSACALAFTNCTLTRLLSVDECLDEFGRCEVQTVKSDAGYETGCSAQVAACILDDPLGFDECIAKWTGKCPGI